MKKQLINTVFIVSASLYSVATQASMLAYCNNWPMQTAYICCPEKGGWVAKMDCLGASANCIKDSGTMANSNPPLTILQDCINRRGSKLHYPYGIKPLDDNAS